MLATRPDLGDLVREAAVRLPAHFPDSEIRLDVAPDPQWPEPAELVLVVVTSLPLVDAFALMDQFADAWWLDTMPAADGLLTITVKRP